MIKLYDTRQRSKVKFESVVLGKIGIYVCGPTVYNYIHIGNARTFISFDIIRRYLMWRGFEVTFVQNITDVDDKIIAKAAEEGRTASEVSEEYTKAFIDDMHALGVLDPDIRPKATEEIDSMIDLIEELIAEDNAYEVDGDVYFSVRSFPGYGELSGRNIDEMESGHRELRSEGQGIQDRKRDPLDFAVWKAAKPGEPSWDSPWGKGRPGWHIECSAMSRKFLGLPFDIHGGGADLVFPHHENERAQSEAACGCRFANYWMHGGMLQIDSEKMSKSLGNFMLLHDVLKTTRPEVLRMLMIQTHYRSPLDFSAERLAESEVALGRIEQAVKNLDWLMEHAEDDLSYLDGSLLLKKANTLRVDFVTAMDDDFNTAGALGVIFSYLSDLNSILAETAPKKSDKGVLGQVRQNLISLMLVFGIDLAKEEGTQEYPQEVISLARELVGYEGNDCEEAVDLLLTCRAEAREQKDWDFADKMRDGCAGIGLRIEDTPQGARISFDD